MSFTNRLNYLKMKSRHHKELRPWRKKWWGKILIILIILIVIILIISTIIVIQKTKEILTEQNQGSQEMSIKNYYKTIEGDGTNYYLGPKQSLYKNYLNNEEEEGIIDIVIFSNFSCEFSAQSSKIMRKLAEEYPDVRFVFRDSPTQDSIILAIAARCAGEQGKFWQMHDLIFEMQEELSLILEEDEKKKVLKELAKSVDLDQKRFNSCLDERRYVNKVKQDYEDGETLGIPGTPTWFINGKSITGTLSENDFKELINGFQNNMNK
ncbi:MAG: thioredoxin domain-containing protein [Patescibacteria group bacterium]|jgi:protein-disulfide isomerase|nr:thioredoxin domain-containing protein [Patescibacteria group bacterium]